MFMMQQPTTPTPPDVAPAIAGGIQAPRTRAEYEALLVRREELRGQRKELNDQRAEMLGQRIMAHTDASRQALDRRVAELDARQARLDQQISALDEAIASASALGVRAPTDPFTMFRQFQNVPPRRGNSDGGFIASVVLGEALAFVLLGVVIWQVAWKRNLARLKSLGASGESSTRLDQLQSAVDVIAVEVERISENQRYVTKVLNERLPSALGAGEAQPVGAKRKIAEPARASDEV